MIGRVRCRRPPGAQTRDGGAGLHARAAPAALLGLLLAFPTPSPGGDGLPEEGGGPVPPAAGAGLPARLEPPPEGLDARDIARRAEENLRSDRTWLEATMTVVSPRLSTPRVVRFRSWDDRPGRRALIRILAPPRDAGTAFLKIHPNLWMYVPRVERTLRIPPSMMLQPWMGSDFTHDDLVRESSQLDDYDHRLLGIDPRSGAGADLHAYVLEYRPRPEAPVVWGRLLGWIEVQRAVPLRTDYFDEEGVHLRTLTLDDVRAVQDRFVPFHWVMRPLDKEGHRTEIRLEAIRFEVDFGEDLFSRRNLRSRP